MHVSTPKYLALSQEKISRYGQYHNIDNIFKQPDESFRSPPSRLHYSDPIEDPLTLYGLYPLSESTSVHTSLTFIDSILDLWLQAIIQS